MVIAVIFDLDGTLIEVKDSYKEAIVRTIQHLRPDLNKGYIYERMQSLKGVPNLNNDWDATYYLLRLIDEEEPKVERDDEWSRMMMIFQSFYLGRDLFLKSYGLSPPVDVDKGLIENETLNIKRETLEELEDYPKGIVTSRPRIEALYALRNSLLGNYFSEKNMVCQEDVEKEKPDPAPLLEIKNYVKGDRYFYVGDNIDDAKASKAAGFTSIIIGEDWGDICIPNINSLPEVLSLYDNK